MNKTALHILKRAAAIAAALIATMSVAQAHAAAGQLDPTFSDDGKQLLPVTTDPVELITQPDGKVVTVSGRDGFTAARVNADGSLDRTFGGDSVVTIDFGQKSGHATAAALQPDGKLVVAGTVELPDASRWIAVARLTQSGSLDPTFDPGGPEGDGRKLYQNIGPDTADAVLIQADGRIVLAGSGWGSFLLARLHPTGDLDSTQWEYADFGDNAWVEDAALAPDGKIVVAGYRSEDDYDPAVARFTPSGELDKSFGDNGTATFGPDHEDDVTKTVRVQPDGKIVLAISALGGQTTTTVRRLNVDGKPDTSFGVDGVATPDFVGTNYVAAAALQPDGKILVTATSASDASIVAARLDSRGATDPSFGDGGTITVPSDSIEVAMVANVDAQGRFLIGGVTIVKGFLVRNLVVRLQADPPPATGASGGSGGAADGPINEQPGPRTDQPAPAPRCSGKQATIVGTPGRDRIKGTRRGDVIVALGGNDVISGLDGNDVVCGGAGDDVIAGGRGRDTLRGEAGKDRLVGGAGRDKLVGGAGRDKVTQ
jgi:uncharacterized delta-60 repeat protein